MRAVILTYVAPYHKHHNRNGHCHASGGHGCSRRCVKIRDRCVPDRTNHFLGRVSLSFHFNPVFVPPHPCFGLFIFLVSQRSTLNSRVLNSQHRPSSKSRECRFDMIILSFRHTNSTKANQLNNYLGRTYYIYMHCCVTFSFLLIHLFAAAVAFLNPIKYVFV